MFNKDSKKIDRKKILGGTFCSLFAMTLLAFSVKFFAHEASAQNIHEASAQNIKEREHITLRTYLHDSFNLGSVKLQIRPERKREIEDSKFNLFGLKGRKINKNREIASVSIPLQWDGSEETKNVKVNQLSQSVHNNANGLRVFWWNVAYGGMNSSIKQVENVSPLDDNITNLIRSNLRPDVLIFGEFKYTALKDETMQLLRSVYGQEYFSTYDNTPRSEVGILVFSKFPMIDVKQTRENERLLDWTPVRGTEIEQASYRKLYSARFTNSVRFWDRKYIRLRLNVNGQVVNLLPVHLLSPWMMISEILKNKQTSKSKKVDLVARAFEATSSTHQILWGEDSPLIYQLKRLRRFIEEDFGVIKKSGWRPKGRLSERLPDELTKKISEQAATLGLQDDEVVIEKEPVILVGDFNTPKSYVLETSGYKILQRGMLDVLTQNEPTWPSLTSSLLSGEDTLLGVYRIPPKDIDHAFVSNHFKTVDSAVLNLRGSDHYAIYFIINKK